MKPVDIPVIGIGPGSQPDDGDRLEFMQMPRGMFRHDRILLPEPEDIAARPGVRRVVDRLAAALDGYRCGEPAEVVPLDGLESRERDLLAQLLGEGEVSISIREEDGEIRIQESILTGVWQVQRVDTRGQVLAERLEVADAPADVHRARRTGRRHLDPTVDALPEGVQNAPALLVEIAEHLSAHRPGAPAHVVNLTLLPLTDADRILLGERLGVGPVTLLSRGYGNCRMGSTAFENIWWIKYYNSQDALILDTIEIVDLPEVALAAPEDLEDSAERIREIRALYA